MLFSCFALCNVFRANFNTSTLLLFLMPHLHYTVLFARMNSIALHNTWTWCMWTKCTVYFTLPFIFVLSLCFFTLLLLFFSTDTLLWLCSWMWISISKAARWCNWSVRRSKNRLFSFIYFSSNIFFSHLENLVLCNNIIRRLSCTSSLSFT